MSTPLERAAYAKGWADAIEAAARKFDADPAARHHLAGSIVGILRALRPPAPSEAATAGEQSAANKALVREARAIGRSLSRPVSDEATMRIGVAPADRLTVALREAAERATPDACPACGGHRGWWSADVPGGPKSFVPCTRCSGRATGGGT